MADDHSKKGPYLTDEDLAIWEAATEKVKEVQSSKEPKVKGAKTLDTVVEDLADNFTYQPHDIDAFERYLDGDLSDPEPPTAKPVVETVHLQKLVEQPIGADVDYSPSNPFEVHEHSADLMVGTRGGVDARTLKKLKQGQFRPTRRLDLHGHYLLDAYQAIRTFVEESQGQGHKCVLVIHGKGRGYKDHQGEEMGVIKRNISTFLSDISSVLAFHTALPRDGGGGACYVLLKSRHKNKPKR